MWSIGEPHHSFLFFSVEYIRSMVASIVFLLQRVNFACTLNILSWQSSRLPGTPIDSADYPVNALINIFPTPISFQLSSLKKRKSMLIFERTCLAFCFFFHVQIVGCILKGVDNVGARVLFPDLALYIYVYNGEGGRTAEIHMCSPFDAVNTLQALYYLVNALSQVHPSMQFPTIVLRQKGISPAQGTVGQP
jgi:hypothetical protein